jgi:ligand-binding sensor domain-containing protein
MRCSFFLLFLLAANLLYSEPVSLRFTHFGTAEGFSSDEINCMAQDPRGFLWVGTQSGLDFFDGQRVKTFRHADNDPSSLPSNDVISLLYDHRGKMWVGTNAGIALFDEHTQRFRIFNSYTKEKTKCWCHRLYEDKAGIIWFSCVEGLGRIDPETFAIKTYPLFGPSSQSQQEWLIGSLLETRDGKLWVGSASGLFLFDRKTEKFSGSLLPVSGLPLTTKISDNVVESLWEDDDGTLWVATWGSGLRHYFPKDGHTETFLFKTNPFMNVNNIVMDLTHRNCAGEEDWLWLSTADNGVMIFNRRTKKFSTYRHDPADPYSVSSDFVGKLFRANDGNLWALSPHGINLLDRYAQRPETYPVVAPQPNPVLRYVASVNEDMADPSGNRLWLTMDLDGLVLYDRTSKSVLRWYGNFPAPQQGEGSHHVVRCFCQDHTGRTWFGNDYGFYLLDTISGKAKWFRPNGGDGKTTVFEDYVSSIVEDRNGLLWMSTRGGLGRFDPATENFHLFKVISDSGHREENRMRELLLAKDGRFWFSTKTRGVGCFDPKAETFTSFEKELPVAYPGSIAEDSKGRIWIAHLTGLCMYDPVTKKTETYTQEQGLGGDQTYRVVVDSHDMIWVSVRGGLTRLDPATKTMRVFRKEDGLQENEVDDLHAGKDDRFYIGWPGLFQAFTPQEMEANPFTAPACMTGFRIFDKPVSFDRDSITQFPVTLSYRQNIITFEFAAPDYSQSKRTHYRYMLEGFDKDWVDAGTKNSATYTNLDGGDYVFKVIAANANDIWNKQPAIFLLHVTPPFWKTGWFRFSSALVIALLVFLLYRRSVNRIRKEEKQKTEFNRKVAEAEMKALRAQMNPHFIFNCMNTIDALVMQRNYDKASAFLNKFSRLIRMVLENSMHKLVPLSTDVQALEIYLQLERERFEEHFDYSITIDEALPAEDYLVPPLLLQPYAENAILHGLRHKEGKGFLHVAMSEENERLKIIVEDNGIGREASSALREKNRPGHRSLGTQVTNERIDIFNFTSGTKADAETEDLFDTAGRPCGTRVVLHLPLIHKNR